MKHIYSDVSHFRAPYKNVSVRGFGATTTNGDVPVPGATCPSTPAQVNQISVLGADGIRRFTKPESDRLISSLHSYKSIFLSATEVKIEPITTEEMAAASADPSSAYAANLEAMRADRWAASKMLEGYAVYLPFAIMCPTEALMSATGLRIGATPSADVEAMKAASVWPTPEMPIGAYLSTDTDKKAATSQASMTPALWALGIIAVVGVGAVMLTKKSKTRTAGRPGLGSLKA
jgi:hypothetical protein